MNVIVRPEAAKAITQLVKYVVAEIQMPETGMQYGRRMVAFANSLAHNWPAYKTCRYRIWESMGLKCAVFDKKYVFAFKVIGENVVIFYIKHGKLLY